MSSQETFNPVDYHFAWEGDWYKWDRKAAHRDALRERNAAAKEYRKQGFRVRCFTLSGQLISRGGIGSGRPHIQLLANVYGLNVFSS